MLPWLLTAPCPPGEQHRVVDGEVVAAGNAVARAHDLFRTAISAALQGAQLVLGPARLDMAAVRPLLPPADGAAARGSRACKRGRAIFRPLAASSRLVASARARSAREVHAAANCQPASPPE